MNRRAVALSAVLAIFVALLLILPTAWTAWRHAVTDGFSLRPWSSAWWAPLTGAAQSVADRTASAATGR